MRKSGYCGVRGGIWWRTGEMNLLMAVFCSHCFFYLAPGVHFYSPDVDECANPRSCPEHSTCHNSLGSYSCVCNPGFQSRSGKKSFQGRGEMCEGICRGLLGNPVQCVCKDRNGGEKLRWVSGEFKALICKAEANSNWFNKHFLSTYCMPSIILGIEVTVITQKKKTFILPELLIMMRESDNRQNTIMYLGCVLFDWVCGWWLDILPCSDSCVGSPEGIGSTLKGAHSLGESGAGCWLVALPEL